MTAESSGKRVSTLVGDRLCVGCGYNLTGQPVVREDHYQMLIVRCPECGTVASLQEYPALGRWAGRWAALIAALWFLAMIGLTSGTAGLLFGLAAGVAQVASEPFATLLAERQIEDLKELEAQGALPANAQWIVANPANPYVALVPSWTTQQDFDALLAEAGGRLGSIDLGALADSFWLGLPVFLMGCAWSVLLLHMRRRWLPAAGLIPFALAAVFATVAHLYGPTRWLGWGWQSAIMLAQHKIGPPVMAMAIVLMFVPFTAGLLAGRPVVRGLIRALLPPRLRSSLALLWTSEGLDPPPGS